MYWLTASTIKIQRNVTPAEPECSQPLDVKIEAACHCQALGVLDQMKKFFIAIIVLAAIYVGLGKVNSLYRFTGSPSSNPSSTTTKSSSSVDATGSAFNEHRSGVQVVGEGIVSKLLPDDNDGSRHQRFILTLSSGQKLLVAHNIDLAPRIASLRKGDTVAFYGVYEWNDKGGVIHWTHLDPGGRHEAGWLKHAGQTYQ